MASSWEGAAPSQCLNYVAYLYNFYTSGPLADKLHEVEIFLVGTINRTAAGFPECRKEIKPPKGTYVSKLMTRRTVCSMTGRWSAGCRPVDCLDTRLYTSTFTSLQQIHGWHGPHGSASDRRHTGLIARVNVMGTLLSVFDYSISKAHFLYKCSYIKHGMKPKTC